MFHKFHIIIHNNDEMEFRQCKGCTNGIVVEEIIQNIHPNIYRQLMTWNFYQKWQTTKGISKANKIWKIPNELKWIKRNPKKMPAIIQEAKKNFFFSFHPQMFFSLLCRKEVRRRRKASCDDLTASFTSNNSRQQLLQFKKTMEVPFLKRLTWMNFFPSSRSVAMCGHWCEEEEEGMAK